VAVLPDGVDPEERLERAWRVHHEAYRVQSLNREGLRSHLDALVGQEFDRTHTEIVARELDASWGLLRAGSLHLAVLAADVDRAEAEADMAWRGLLMGGFLLGLGIGIVFGGTLGVAGMAFAVVASRPGAPRP